MPVVPEYTKRKWRGELCKLQGVASSEGRVSGRTCPLEEYHRRAIAVVRLGVGRLGGSSGGTAVS